MHRYLLFGGDLKGMRSWDSAREGQLDFKTALRNYIVQTLIKKITVEVGGGRGTRMF